MFAAVSDDANAPLTAQEEDLLRALARLVAYVPRAFEADLGRTEHLSWTEYLTLMHLSDAPGHALRMGELAAATALTVGRMTQLVTRLEAQDLVRRRPAETDRRGQVAVLTPTGVRRLEAARPAHVASVRRRLLDKLDGMDLATCTEALTRLGTDT